MPLSAEVLQEPYRTPWAYRQLVRQDVDKLVAQRFLTPQDGRLLRQEAADTVLPTAPAAGTRTLAAAG